jgi:hypothetical protein
MRAAASARPTCSSAQISVPEISHRPISIHNRQHVLRCQEGRVQAGVNHDLWSMDDGIALTAHPLQDDSRKQNIGNLMPIQNAGLHDRYNDRVSRFARLCQSHGREIMSLVLESTGFPACVEHSRPAPCLTAILR